MFEALRGLRDAVAPESGNLGGITGNSTGSVNNESSEPDLEEMWQAYRSGDPETLAMVKKATTSVPQKREDFVRIHAKMEMEKDAELVKKLAESVLEKSANIDFRVSHILGMERTRAQQMIYIEDLMQKNHEVSERLQQAYSKASERRDVVRKFVKDLTCEALGIEEGTN